MTAKVGDTIKVGTVRRAGSRTTKLHYFTIEALGIDHAMVSGGSIEPLVLELTEAGTIIVDDSSDPGEHGIFQIDVAPSGSGPVVYVGPHDRAGGRPHGPVDVRGFPLGL